MSCADCQWEVPEKYKYSLPFEHNSRKLRIEMDSDGLPLVGPGIDYTKVADFYVDFFPFRAWFMLDLDQ